MQILLSSIYPYIFLLLFLTIPFDNYFRSLPNILLLLLALLFPFVVKKQHFTRLAKTPTFVLILFLVWIVVISISQGRWLEDQMVIQKIGLVGALVLLYLPVDGFKKINKAIIFSSLSAIVYSLIKLLIFLNEGHEVSFLESATIIETVLMDRVYLGFLAVLSILASYNLIKKEFHPDNGYYLANIVLNVLFILFIVSRIAIIALAVIFVVSLFYKDKRGPQLLFAIGFLGLVVGIIFLMNNDLQKKFFYKNNNVHKEGLVANTLALEPRVVLWNCGLEISKKPGVFLKGLGFTNTNKEMVKCYGNIEDIAKRKWFQKQKYNSHNQYLDLYAGAGILAVLSFALGLVLLFVKNRQKLYPTALLITMMLFLGVENMFHRQMGAYYLGYVLILLLITETIETEKEEMES